MTKILFDFFPLLLFLAAYHFADIYVATKVMMVAAVLQFCWAFFVRRKVEPLLWITLIVAVGFGSLTLIYHDTRFIRWKPSAIYWLMAAAMAFTKWVLHKNAIRSLLGAQLELPAAAWTRLNLSMMGFFVVMGALNLVVAFRCTEQTWVYFKTIGTPALSFAFMLVQGLMMLRDQEEKKE